MVFMNEQSFSGESLSPEEAKALEVRASFKVYVSEIGLEVAENLFKSADRNKDEGRRGITVPSTDSSIWMAIDEEVSFRVGDYGPYVIPMDTAKAVLYEMNQEQAEESRHDV